MCIYRTILIIRKSKKGRLYNRIKLYHIQRDLLKSKMHFFFLVVTAIIYLARPKWPRSKVHLRVFHFIKE